MRFSLIDRIDQLEKGAHISAIKNVSLSEEYLADHFPRFPVLPGVLMLEAMTQASAWLIRATEDFAHSVVVLKESRNVKYADFVGPGRSLTVTAEVVLHGERETKLKTCGSVNGVQSVSARLVLERYNLVEADPEKAATDHYIKRKMREMFSVLYSGQSPKSKQTANDRNKGLKAALEQTMGG